MIYYEFQKIFDEFSKKQGATKAEEHDVGKVREKFTEIVEAVGVDINLLRTHKSYETGKIIKNNNPKGSFYFPEDSIDFCVDLIVRHTTLEFKSIRRGEFDNVSLNTLEYLINGFLKYLIGLGYSIEMVLEQKYKMDIRFGYTLRIERDELVNQYEDIKNIVEKLIISCGMNYYDYIFFVRYMSFVISNSRNKIQEVLSAYRDIRMDEIYDISIKESKKVSEQEAIERINRELIVAHELQHDAEYQKLINKEKEILQRYDFKKKLKGPFNKVLKRMEEIEKRCEKDIFGDILSDEEETQVFVKHPLKVLEEAIEYVEECNQDTLDRYERRINMTQKEIEDEKKRNEKILEAKGRHFVLPSRNIEDDMLYITNNFEDEIEGIINFPCCNNEKIIVYKGTTGRCLNKCPNCGKYVIFDFDDMLGEAKKLVNKKTHFKN